MVGKTIFIEDSSSLQLVLQPRSNINSNIVIYSSIICTHSVSGRVITAAYVPLINYHSLFPDTMTSTTLLATRRNV